MRVLAMLLALLVAPAALAAEVFDDPGELVEYAYEPYRTDEFRDDRFELYSSTLLELWAMMEARTPDGDVGAVDFDPLINGQDYEIEDLTVGEAEVDGERASVVVTFRNFGEPQEIHLSLVQETAGWKIDDMESLTEPYPWRLSELLAADPLPN